MMNVPLTRLRVLVLLSLFVVALALPASHASAQSDACDDLVDLFGVDDPGALQDVIDDAEAATGIDFHVFATDTLAAGQDLAAASFANCAGAYIVPGEVVDDTVVIAVAVEDRDFAVVYGGNLNDRLDDDVDAIFDRMAAWFQNGDFGSGLAAGVDEAADGLETEPGNVVGWVGVGAGGAAALVGGGAAITAVRRKNKRQSEAAAAEYDRISSQVTTVQARWYDAEDKASFLGDRLTGLSMERLEAAQLQAVEASRRLHDAWSPVSDLDGAHVASLDDASRAEAFEYVSKAAVISEENAGALQSFETVLTELDGAVDQMATLHRTTSERIVAGRQAAVARSGEGWDVSAPNERLDQLEKMLGHIDAFALRIDVDTMKPALEPLAVEAESIASDLEQLDQRRDEATTRRTTVANEATGQRNRLGTAQTMIDGWRLAHAAASYEGALHYPGEAAKQLERAQAHLREADSVGEIPRNVGVLREVSADIDAADVAIDLADELLDNLDALDVELSAALRDAPRALAEARTDAATLAGYVSTYRNDLPPAAQEVARHVADDLAEAEAALTQSPPDSLLALELSEDIGEEVDEQLAKFKAAVDERERIRNAANSHLRAAQTAIERADRHVSSHLFSGRQAASAQGQIDELRLDFNQLVGAVADNPEHVISRAQNMTITADQIYREAQRRQRNSRRSGGAVILGRGGFGGGRRSTSRSRSRTGARPSTRSRSRSRSSGRRSGGFKGGRSGKF